MEILSTERVIFERDGKTIEFTLVAVHEPNQPTFTIIATCDTCGTELGRRSFDASNLLEGERAAHFGYFDALVQRNHVCGPVASC